MALVAIVCGTIPAGYGINPWICVGLGLVAMVGLLLVVGRKSEPPAEASSLLEP